MTREIGEATAHARSALVVGAGTMGAGIATVLANAGLATRLTDQDPGAVARALDRIDASYASAVARGRMAETAARAARARIDRGPPAPDTDIAIEAAIENLPTKRAIFAELDRALPSHAILATNTSSLDIDAIASATGRPDRVLGLHFFSPPVAMRLIEIVQGAATSEATIAASLSLAERLGKVAVIARNAPGFIGNRILHAYQREADFLLEEGASPAQVDAAMIGFGFPMGVYRVRDLAGLDVGWRIRQARAGTRDPALRYPPVGDWLCEQGRFGQKTGAGFYRYEDGRTPIADPAVDALIARAAAEQGIARAPVPDAEIVGRVLTRMVNEAAMLLGEGVAASAADIDTVCVNGYGFPREQGGPMRWAEQRGLARVLSDVETYRAAHGAIWAPAPLLVARAPAGRWA